MSVGRSVDEAFPLVWAFQLLSMVGGVDAVRMQDEHGEVCPANWREGGKAIRGDPIAKLDYFAAVDGRHENGKVNWQKVPRVD